MSKRRSPQEKAGVVTEFFTIDISATGLRRRHTCRFLPAKTRRKVLPEGRQALAGGGGAAKNRTKEAENLERTIGGITVANDILQNHGGGNEMELRAASGASSHMASVDVFAYAGDGHVRDVQDGALHLALGLLDRVEIRAARREELEFYGATQILERLPDDLGCAG